MIPYIETPAGISFVISNGMKTLSCGDPKFEEIRNLILSDGSEAQVAHALLSTIRKIAHVVRLTPYLDFDGATVFHNGAPLHNYAVDRLIELINRKLPCTPLVNFLDKLVQNPSYRVVEQLYQFLEYGNIPLKENGNFVAYKAIRADWTDIHSGHFNNAVGQKPTVARNSVDEDPDRTCSYGLHVCSFSYLPHFAHAQGHVVAVEVNPADVVAIPRDYNNTKMRCCSYEVIAEVTNYYEENHDILADSPVYGECDMSSTSDGFYRIDVQEGPENDWEKYASDLYEEEETLDMLEGALGEGYYAARAFRPNQTEPFAIRTQ